MIALSLGLVALALVSVVLLAIVSGEIFEGWVRWEIHKARLEYEARERAKERK